MQDEHMWRDLMGDCLQQFHRIAMPPSDLANNHSRAIQYTHVCCARNKRDLALFIDSVKHNSILLLIEISGHNDNICSVQGSSKRNCGKKCENLFDCLANKGRLS